MRGRCFPDMTIILTGGNRSRTAAASFNPSIVPGTSMYVDVGQNKVDFAGTKTFDSLVCVGNSDHGMTRILQSQLNVHEDQGLVLDD